MKSIFEQRREWWNALDALKAERKAKVDALIAEDEATPGGLSDEQWDERHDAIYAEYEPRIDQAYRRWFWLQYRQTRNEWFQKFVESFGMCESRRITRKQGEIFAKYSEMNHDHDSGRGTTYYVRCNGKCIKTTTFSKHEPCYVTIIEF